MILLIDNYDSFTFNLAQALWGLGADLVVRRNDQIDVAALVARPPLAIVISPGPGRPAEAGVSVEVVTRLAGKLPILGVCLGLQSIAEAAGGRVIRAGRVVHGKSSPVRHDGTGLFAGLPNPMTAGRYHSLVVERQSLPAALAVAAVSDDDGEVMAIRHREWPLYGVQFHPESILTPEGTGLLANFLDGVRR